MIFFQNSRRSPLPLPSGSPSWASLASSWSSSTFPSTTSSCKWFFVADCLSCFRPLPFQQPISIMTYFLGQKRSQILYVPFTQILNKYFYQLRLLLVLMESYFVWVCIFFCRSRLQWVGISYGRVSVTSATTPVLTFVDVLQGFVVQLAIGERRTTLSTTHADGRGNWRRERTCSDGAVRMAAFRPPWNNLYCVHVTIMLLALLRGTFMGWR